MKGETEEQPQHITTKALSIPGMKIVSLKEAEYEKHQFSSLFVLILMLLSVPFPFP